MRARPIDDFLTETEEGRIPAVVPTTSPIDGRSYDWNRIVSEGRAARAAADGGAWHIGRLALLVEKRYRSGSLQRFSEAIGESYGTVRRFRWVAGAYEPTIRTRFTGLSFSHFQAVASLPDRLMWLQRAYRRGWSVDRLVTESRKTDARVSSEALLRKPIEAASKRLARLATELDAEGLDDDARAHLAAAIDELASHVDQLRACLDGRAAKPRRTRRPAARARRTKAHRGTAARKAARVR